MGSRVLLCRVALSTYDRRETRRVNPWAEDSDANPWDRKLMGVLKSEPEGVVESLPELMAIAKAMEDEAAMRYRQLSRRMRSLDNNAAVKVFEHLASEEEAHSARVTELSVAVTGCAPKPADIRWELPPDLEDEGMADLAVSRLVTPYRALSIAVRNEDRAFAFWSYVSAYAPSEAVRRYAERMAREELRHASILRMERRRAYHGELRAAGLPPAISMRELQEKAASLEEGIRRTCRSLASAAAVSGDEATADLLGRIAEAGSGNRRASVFSGVGPSPTQRHGAPDSVVMIDQAIAACETAAEIYLQAAESAADEGVALEAQRLSKSAITRLVALRGRRVEIAPVQFEDEPGTAP